LLNLAGEVIGVNVAMSEEAENIGFAIPINDAKRGIKQVEEKGEIVYPFLGIYYIIITPETKESLGLPVGYGALIGMDEKGEETEGAVVPGSAAEEAGLKRGDIILEFDGSQVSRENPLSEILMSYDPGDIVALKILRDGKEETLPITLGKRED
jgi:S1-C subfamily serine protease